MKRTERPYKRPDRQGWFGTVYTEDGKRQRVQLATEKEGYEKAVVRLDRHRKRIDLIEAGVATRADFEVADAGKVLITDALVDFRQELIQKRKRSERYADEFNAWINRLLIESKASHLSELIREDIETFLDGLIEDGLTASSRNTASIRISTFLGWCKRKKLVRENVAAKLPAASTRHDKGEKPRALSFEQFDALIANTPDESRKLRYLLGARTGLRWHEIHRLRWRHLDLKRAFIELPAEIQKIDRHDELPLATPIVELAKRIRPKQSNGDELIFKSQPTRYTWLRDLDRAGIIKVTGTVRKKTFSVTGYRDDRGRTFNRRCLRHTYGTHLAARQVSITDAAMLMRHADPKTTLKFYTDSRLLDLNAAVARLEINPALAAGQENKTTNNDPQNISEGKAASA